MPTLVKGSGDGDYSTEPDYTPAPEETQRIGIPHGKLIEFFMNSATSKVFPGINRPFERLRLNSGSVCSGKACSVYLLGALLRPARIALTMAWFRTERYHRVLSYSGTFVDLRKGPEAHAAYKYPEHFFPDTPVKLLRIWMHVSENDTGEKSASAERRNWVVY